jgi:hypothetical protein
MKFDPPNTSPSYQTLIQEVEKAGLEALPLRRLLWLINAHPALIGHGQVLAHVLAHLESDSFQPSAMQWAGDWKVDLPGWVQICKWIADNRLQLALQPELTSFNRHIQGKNPLVGEGVGRHGVPAALWNTHETCKYYPLREGEMTKSAQAYFELQGHLLVSYIHCRFKLSTLEFYESYKSEKERPIAPSRTEIVGLAVRELSHNKYAQYLDQLPSTASTIEFAKGFSNALKPVQGLDLEIMEDGERHLLALKRYFHRFTLVESGWKPDQELKTGWGGGGGGHAWKHGFVHVPGPGGVYLQIEATTDEDPEFPMVAGTNVLVSLDTEHANDLIAVEKSGLSPDETLEQVFRLYSAEEMKGRQHAARLRLLAAEGRAQSLSFDYSKLTRQELQEVNALATSAIERFLNEGKAEGDFKQDAIGGLLLRIMLCLGQSVGQARAIRCEWIVGTSDGVVIEQTRNHLAVVVTTPAKGDWLNARVTGFRLPGIMPDYRARLPEALADIDRESVNSFLLPDMLGLGQQLLSYMRLQSSDALNVFGIQEKTANSAVDSLLQSLQDSRITKGKVSNAMVDIITQQTGDQSLAWVVTGDSRQANQPRMHYTRYPVNTLVSEFRRASRRLGKYVGIRLEPQAPALAATETKASVGARFVIEMSEVQGVVSRLLSLLSERYQASLTDRQVRRYHLLFLLYTHVYQSILTSIRAISSPSAAYLGWLDSSQRTVDIRASLSDKDTKYSDRARLVPIPPPLAAQFGHYQRHRQMLGARLPLAAPWLSTLGEDEPFFIIKSDYTVGPLTPGWVKGALQQFTSYDIPANFHRSFLRTELLARGCAAEVIDAHLGHANFGEIPHSKLSTYDYGKHFKHLQAALQSLHDEIGLRPVASRLIPRAVRLAA